MTIDAKHQWETDSYFIIIDEDAASGNIYNKEAGKYLVLLSGDIEPFMGNHFEATYENGEPDSDALIEKLLDNLGYGTGDWK
jgi:hypothetical protein